MGGRAQYTPQLPYIDPGITLFGLYIGRVGYMLRPDWCFRGGDGAYIPPVDPNSTSYAANCALYRPHMYLYRPYIPPVRTHGALFGSVT